MINILLRFAVVILDSGVRLGEKKHGILLIFICQILLGATAGFILVSLFALLGWDQEIFISFEH